MKLAAAFGKTDQISKYFGRTSFKINFKCLRNYEIKQLKTVRIPTENIDFFTEPKIKSNIWETVSTILAIFNYSSLEDKILQ